MAGGRRACRRRIIPCPRPGRAPRPNRMMRGRARGGVMRSMPLYGVFAALLAYLSGRRSPAAPDGRLIDCVACGTDYVCAVDWEETDDVHWWIRLRCGVCGTVREVVVT